MAINPPKMKSALLIKLLQRCIGYQEMILKAKERKTHFVEVITRHQLTTFQNELKLWPLGRPNPDSKYGGYNYAEQGLKSMDAIIDRMENGYYETLIKINSYSLKTQPQ